jgi:hypothetical protein
MKSQIYFFSIISILSMVNFTYSVFTMDVLGASLSLALSCFSLYIVIKSETQTK